MRKKGLGEFDKKQNEGKSHRGKMYNLPKIFVSMDDRSENGTDRKTSLRSTKFWGQ